MAASILGRAQQAKLTIPIGNIIGRVGQNRTVTSSAQNSDAGVTPHPEVTEPRAIASRCKRRVTSSYEPCFSQVVFGSLAEIKTAIPLTTDEAVMTSSVINVKVLVAQMRTVIAAISEYDRQIEALCLTHDDYHLFAALRVVSPYFFLLWLFCRGKQAVR